MKNRLMIYFVGLAIVLAGAVYAAPLLSEKKVLTCVDTDGGVIVNITGTVSGISLSGTNYSLTDSCLTNTTLYEYACRTTANETYYQKWSQNCTALGLTCVSGRCQ